jgi:hypothetical protein
MDADGFKINIDSKGAQKDPDAFRRATGSIQRSEPHSQSGGGP